MFFLSHQSQIEAHHSFVLSIRLILSPTKHQCPLMTFKFFPGSRAWNRNKADWARLHASLPIVATATEVITRQILRDSPAKKRKEALCRLSRCVGGRKESFLAIDFSPIYEILSEIDSNSSAVSFFLINYPTRTYTPCNIRLDIFFKHIEVEARLSVKLLDSFFFFWYWLQSFAVVCFLMTEKLHYLWLHWN